MTASDNPARKLAYPHGTAGARRGYDGPLMPKAFAACPESRRLMAEMIFDHKFESEFAARTKLVGVNEVHAMKSTASEHCVGTRSLSSCVGFALFDEQKKVGAAAHVMLEADTPAPEPVERMISLLIDAANMVGGSAYRMFIFNAREGARGWNGQLSAFVDNTLQRLSESGIIRGYEHSDARSFVLDTKTGHIFTGA